MTPRADSYDARDRRIAPGEGVGVSFSITGLIVARILMTFEKVEEDK